MSTTYKRYSYDVPWEDMVPGAYVSRVEVCQQMVDLFYSEPKGRDGILRSLARTGAVSVGQLASLSGLTRQRIYIKLLQWGVDRPEHSVRGVIDEERVNDFLRACVQMQSIKHVKPDVFMRLQKAGSRAVVFHLTGVDIGRKA